MGVRLLPLILLSGFCGGGVYPLIKIANAYQIPKFAYIFWESLTISCLLLLVSVCRGEKLKLRREESGYYVFCAFTNIIISQILFFIVAKHLPASILGIITVLTPMMVYISSLLFFGETLIGARMIGVCLGFLGTAILFLPSFFQSEVQVDWRWLLFSLLLPINYSLNRLFVTRLRPADSSNSSLTLGLFATVAGFTFIAMLSTGDIYIPLTNPSWGDLALLSHAVLMTIFYIAFFAIARTGAVQNSLSFYVAPLVALGWGVIVFNESIGYVFCLATVLVFAGLHFVTRREPLS
jgi:drug/metabolite transporter (DMT)-like permease